MHELHRDFERHHAVLSTPVAEFVGREPVCGERVVLFPAHSRCADDLVVGDFVDGEAVEARVHDAVGEVAHTVELDVRGVCVDEL